MKSMNDKTKTSGAIILPDRDGVASLDIKRVQTELEDKPREMCGHMPADLIPVVLKELKKMVKQVEEGQVSSICLLGVLPQDAIIDAGSAFISAADGELEKLHELFHLALLQRLGEEPPDDEAG
jgi:hypothetical protein